MISMHCSWNIFSKFVSYFNKFYANFKLGSKPNFTILRSVLPTAVIVIKQSWHLVRTGLPESLITISVANV